MFLSRHSNRIKVIYLFLTTLFVMAFVIREGASNQCLVSEPGDSEYFARSSAINDKYLAVGDSEANRVVIYTRNAKGKWLRSREILPPKGSEAEIAGSGFGYDVALDGSTLVIGASGGIDKPKNPEAYQYTNKFGTSYFGRVYRTTLDNNKVVERIEISSKGEVPNGMVSASGGRIAYSVNLLGMNGKDKVYLYENGKINNAFVTPRTIEDDDYTAFGASIAIKDNFLIIGSPGDSALPQDPDKGAAWLINLKSTKNKPQRLFIPDKPIGHTVTVSERFAAISVKSRFYLPTAKETLVTSLEDGSTTLVEGVGKLSSDGNILAMMLPYVSRGGYTQKALLRVYDLTNFNEPQLILKRGNIDDGYVQNNYLVTTKKILRSTKTKVCVEKIIR